MYKRHLRSRTESIPWKPGRYVYNDGRVHSPVTRELRETITEVDQVIYKMMEK